MTIMVKVSGCSLAIKQPLIQGGHPHIPSKSFCLGQKRTEPDTGFDVARQLFGEAKQRELARYQVLLSRVLVRQRDGSCFRRVQALAVCLCFVAFGNKAKSCRDRVLLAEAPSFCLWQNVRGLSSAGRAPALQAGGHRFDPDRLHQKAFARRKRSEPDGRVDLARQLLAKPTARAGASSAGGLLQFNRCWFSASRSLLRNNLPAFPRFAKRSAPGR